MSAVRRARRAVVLALSLGPLASAGQAVEIGLAPVFEHVAVERPVGLFQAPEDGARWFLVEQGGRVLSFTENPLREPEVFVDLQGRVIAGGEMGLLGMAFHPAYAANRQVFLSYTRLDARNVLHSRIARFVSRDGGRTLDPDSEQVILEVEQPYRNHNGGKIEFGPDGDLYIALGDGGAAGDPRGHGQNPHTLLGAMLRIDVDGAPPYAIPADNPFVEGGGRAEVFAWGLRNPWGWSFDRATGTLWAGDVGQNRWEEINRIERGGNYGWNIREGSECFRATTCDATGLIDPVAVYGHDQGCSVTGGYVYRGRAIDGLNGVFLYGDFCSGRIWGLFPAGDELHPRLLVDSDLSISSFAQGRDGEVYVLGYRGGGIYRVVPGRP